jgi:hypothetical protein
MSHEIIRSLEKIQDQVKQELLDVKTYRAFVALDKAIEEISEIEEIARSLTGIRGQVVDRLNDVREYRALLAVEKSVLDISEVLKVLEDASKKRAEATTDIGPIAAPAGQVTDAVGASTSTAAAGQSETHAPATQTAAAMDHGRGYEPAPTPTGDVEFASGGAAHEDDAAPPTVTAAMVHPPSLSTADMANQTGEQHQHPQFTGESAEHGAAHVPHEADAASRSETDMFRHSTTPPAVLMDGQTHQPEQPPEPTRETAEKDANSVVQQGDAPESEDIGVAKVA